MKPLLLIIICILTVLNSASSQCNSGQQIQSPVAKKPTEPNTASLSCNTLLIKWKGHSNQVYEITVTVKDASTNKEIRTFTTKNFQANGSNYTSTITVPFNTRISWSVQAIKLTNDRVFYSYPLHGDKDYLVPACDEKPAIALNDKRNDSLMVIADKKMEVKVYPNPVQSILNIDFNNTGTSKKTINIFNVNGKTVISRQTIGKAMQVDVKQLTGGAYLIRIQDEAGQVLYNGKIIKQ